MKKFNTMLEDEFLNPRSDLVPCGLQQQFPISVICHFMSAFGPGRLNYRSLVAILLLTHGLALWAQPKPIVLDPQNGWTDVYWGTKGNKDPNRNNVLDTGAAGGWTFNWTVGGASDPNYAPFTAPPGGGAYRFWVPDEGSLQTTQKITDWEQKVGKSVVSSGNIQQHSPWSFQPLEDLPLTQFRIPDFATLLDSDPRVVYAAVDLATYCADNPLGPLGGAWSVGQTLDDLGLQIVNGQIPGVQGLYFATTDFTLDPNSPTGWVPIGGSSAWLDSSTFESGGLPMGIIAEHEVIPEPSTLALVGLGTLSLLAYVWRRRNVKAQGIPANHLAKQLSRP